jgi:hypothetical protein
MQINVPLVAVNRKRGDFTVRKEDVEKLMLILRFLGETDMF